MLPIRNPQSSIRNRRGFTLIELMVVLGIILVVGGMTTAAFVSMNKGQQVRDTSQLVQAALIGARTRAMADGTAVGVRVITDPNDPSLGIGLVLVSRMPDLTTGTVHLVRPDKTALPGGDWLPGDDPRPDVPPGTVPTSKYPGISNNPGCNVADQADANVPPVLIVAGLDVNGASVVWPQALFEDGGSIRFEQSGPFYDFAYIDSRHLWLSDVSPAVPMYNPVAETPPGTFDTNLQANEGIEYTIRLRTGNLSVRLAGADPILFPGDVVIDLGQMPVPGPPPIWPDPADFRLSRLEPVLWVASVVTLGPPIVWEEAWRWEILFSPNRQVLPPQSRMTYAGFWIRERDVALGNLPVGIDPWQRRAMMTGNGVIDHALVTVNTRTGDVASSRPVFRDAGNGFWDFAAYYDNVVRGNETGL